MEELFKNKVTESGIVTVNLEDYFPKEEIVVFDMKNYLFMDLILKEKDFRAALKSLDTERYRSKIVAVTCSSDAIIPVWAYMLVASLLQPVAKELIFGNESAARQNILSKNIASISLEEFVDRRIVIKGCGEVPVPEDAYFEITKLLKPVVKSIMYGEPCSTVPVYKREKSSAIEIPSVLNRTEV